MSSAYHDAPTDSTTDETLTRDRAATAEAAAAADRAWVAAARTDAERVMRRNYAAQAAVIRARAMRGDSPC